MDAEGLARKARSLRAEKGLTQDELANLLVERGHYPSLSKQSISRAENDQVVTGEKLFELRVLIIQELSGAKLQGPVWLFEDAA